MLAGCLGLPIGMVIRRIGGGPLAGHAPKFVSPAGRFLRWVLGLSDLRISLYMLLGAAAVCLALGTLDYALFR